MVNDIFSILKLFRCGVNLYRHEATAEAVEYLESTGTQYMFTEIEKNDGSGGYTVFSFIDNNELQMIEWEWSV